MRILRRLFRRNQQFKGSESYWKERYDKGGTSGDGSYRELAEFKAEVINAFVMEHGVQDIIEFGCGDGNQLRLGRYSQYLGFDVSPKAVQMCRAQFKNDKKKSFKLIADYTGERATLTLSLDVILHLVEDSIFDAYMRRIFDSSRKYVIIYSSNFSSAAVEHVRHRNFTAWISANRPGWRLLRHIPNRYPFRGDTRTGSRAEFYFYVRSDAPQDFKRP